jgi:sulfide:quinone oxidoreductase
LSVDAILATAREAGYDLAGLAVRIAARAVGATQTGSAPTAAPATRCRVLVVGGGAGGGAVTASLLKRRPDLDIVIVEPRDEHYYQPGWTLVGAGVFGRDFTARPMADILPKGARRIRNAVAAFEPERNQVVLDDGARIEYEFMIAAPGLKLDWGKVEGLEEALGRNGVTSNYRFDLAPYTWKLVQEMKGGAAIFTQPLMPIKCAGAPQKAMYLSCDGWARAGVLDKMSVSFCNANAALFGVADYVPALMEYVRRYRIGLELGTNLVAIDSAAKTARFVRKNADGVTETVTRAFDMIHVCPPQSAPDFVAKSALADAAGWIDVDQATLRHKRFPNVFSLGDACSAPNAKTAAAVRKQAPVVAENLLAVIDGREPWAGYDGYGSCPLTVEKGKIVLAEFGYGGKLLPTFPKALIDGTRPTRLAWFLKEKMLPDIYWRLMLRGREWLATPKPKS